jgi:pilus assembly protein CpaF
MALRERLGLKPEQRAESATEGNPVSRRRASEARLTPLDQMKVMLHRKVIEHLDLATLNTIEDKAVIEREIRRAVARIVQDERISLDAEQGEKVVEGIFYEITGLGPLEPLFDDPEITDILVNGPYQVYIERNGLLSQIGIQFRDDAHLLAVIDRIVSRIGRRIDEASPMVDARLADGSRVNAIIPPLALDGPLLSIRRFGARGMRIEDLLEIGSITQPMAYLLEGCTKARLNILISGGTGAGKTTLLNAISRYIPSSERIVTIQAMNTGHEGSLTTIHANSPRDALARLETMILMAGTNLPDRAMREQIASALDVVIQVSRLSDGTRRVVSITEVTGMEGEIVSMQEIFTFERMGVNPEGQVIGRFRPTGVRPAFARKLEVSGVELPPSMFNRAA